MVNPQFVQEFNAVSGSLRGFAMNLVRDASLADDLFQETALRAFRYQSKYEGNTNLKAWLSTIMRNLFINQYRKEKKRQEGKDAKVSYYEYFQGASVNNAGELEINANEINQVIDELDDMYRIPFQMYYEGYKYEEIQKEMAPLPMGTIKSRIHIARKKLKERLAQLEIAKR